MSMHKGLIGKSEGGGSVKPTYEDRTLGDYINRKQRQAAFDAVAEEKKLTFEEWYRKYFGLDTNPINMYGHGEQFKACWKAAQENK